MLKHIARSGPFHAGEQGQEGPDYAFKSSKQAVSLSARSSRYLYVAVDAKALRPHRSPPPMQWNLMQRSRSRMKRAVVMILQAKRVKDNREDSALPLFLKV
jgi:hypothetical protein